MIGAYGSAVLIAAAAVVLGRAICVLAGRGEAKMLWPPVGFAALMVLCEVAIALPGRGWTAVAVVVVACAASLWVGSRGHAGWLSVADAVPVALATLVFVSVPFLANDRVGILGLSFLNDTHWHLLLAQHLLQPTVSTYGYGPGYPLGPHAIAATFAQGLGSNVAATLTGVLMATPLLTGLTAVTALGDLARSRRWVVAALAAIPYLAAAWYVQSAFKEPILSLLLLGLVLALARGREDGFARPIAVFVPAAVVLAGVIYDYSYPGLIWPVAIVACWLALELVLAGPRLLLGGPGLALRRMLGRLRGVAPAFAIGTGLLVVLVAPEIGRIHEFWVSNGGSSTGNYGGITSTSLANLYAPLYGFEGLDIWLSGDFRLAPSNAVNAGVLAGLALVVLAYAVLTSLRRRELVWVGAIGGCLLVYAYVKHTQSPYVAAKALVVPAPLVMLFSGRAAMRWVERADLRQLGALGITAALVAFFVFAFQSSFLALRDAFVGPDSHLKELRALRPMLHRRPTLALIYDDYIAWELLGVPVLAPEVNSSADLPLRPSKPFVYGRALDFDSVDAATLDRFTYVITTNTDAQSQPPPNFHLVASSRDYEVWERVGPTPPHLVLPESGAPGAILDCSTAAGRGLEAHNGTAMVRSQPRYLHLQRLSLGDAEHVVVSLPVGAWDLSVQYTSDEAVTVQGAGLKAWLPANKDRPGGVWPLGRLRSTGHPVVLTVRMANPGLVYSDTQAFSPGSLIAVKPGRDAAVPLHAACGDYVDWYTLS